MNRYGSTLVNILTIFAFLCACLVGGIYAALLADPRLPINPFPPAPPPTVLVLPTAKNTSVFNLPTLPPTKVPALTEQGATSTLVVVATSTPTPTRTLIGGATITVTPSVTGTATSTQIVQVTTTGTPGTLISVTATPLPSNTATQTPTITFTPSKTRGAFDFVVQEGNPIALANVFNSKGCAWMGVVGQAFDLNLNPRIGLIVHVEGGGLSIDAFTGSKPAVGPAGYEIQLSDRPIQTSGTYKVQMRDTGGVALSDFVTLSTSASCDKNAILLNFVQAR
ncbi:MAG: hypothetical protein AABZ78_04170 [Chloroflexota bacterium]